MTRFIAQTNVWAFLTCEITRFHLDFMFKGYDLVRYYCKGGVLMKLKVLVADDDPSLRNLICDILKKQGYDPIAAADGNEAIDRYFEASDISLVILDVMMPGSSGFEVLREIREHSDVPVLMLTALGDEQNEITGLTDGANDYIAKPFSYPILIARIEALLRKTKKEKSSDIILGQLEFKRTSHKVLLRGEELELNNKEYQLLELLVSNHGIVMERGKILDMIWGYDYDGDDKTINTHIKMLRSKLGSYSSYIKTIKGTGYMFEAK